MCIWRTMERHGEYMPDPFTDEVKEWLQAALDRTDTHSMEDVIESVGTGHMQLWVGDKGAAVTQILNFPRKKILHVFLAGGDLEQVLDFVPSFMTWGELQGCSKITMSGRKGWGRVLPKSGWRETGVIMEYENG